MNYIVLNGVKSTTISGLLICDLPPITKPQMRVKKTEINGRDGAIFDELGYSSYKKNVKIGLHGNYDIDEVIKYFNFEGTVQFSNEPYKIYKAKIVAQIDFDRILRYKQATISFMVQPFKYDGLVYHYTASGQAIFNKGNTLSKPIFDLTGSGTITMSIDGIEMFTYTFPEGENQVIIDSAEEEAYFGSLDYLRNRQMSGEFPTLSVGQHSLTWSGDLTKVKLSEVSRWL